MRSLFGPVQQGTEMDVTGGVASVVWLIDGRPQHSDIVTRSGVRFKAFPDTAGGAPVLSPRLAAEEDGSLQALALERSKKFGLCGLILQRLTTASKFRRVGFFCCCDRHRMMAMDRLRHLHREEKILECSHLAVGDFQDGRVVVI